MHVIFFLGTFTHLFIVATLVESADRGKDASRKKNYSLFTVSLQNCLYMGFSPHG